MEANGFRAFIPAPNFIIWTNDHDISLIQENDIYANEAPFLFQWEEGDTIQKSEIKYEHQLKLLIDDYESRLIKEVGQSNLF